MNNYIFWRDIVIFVFSLKLQLIQIKDYSTINTVPFTGIHPPVPDPYSYIAESATTTETATNNDI